jgi:hypothetical protein
MLPAVHAAAVRGCTDVVFVHPPSGGRGVMMPCLSKLAPTHNMALDNLRDVAARDGFQVWVRFSCNIATHLHVSWKQAARGLCDRDLNEE